MPNCDPKRYWSGPGDMGVLRDWTGEEHPWEIIIIKSDKRSRKGLIILKMIVPPKILIGFILPPSPIYRLRDHGISSLEHFNIS
jgi:hypothetical protein